jgi:transposase
MLRWEMIHMDQVTAIRHAVLALGHSRRRAARSFKVARGTVDRYLDDQTTPTVRQSPPRPAPKRTAAITAIEALVSRTVVAKKQQLTGKRAWELLTEQGLDIGYTTVRTLMAAQRRAQAEMFIPQSYSLGDLAEVDFFEVVVDVDGERTRAFLFVMRPMSSSRCGPLAKRRAALAADSKTNRNDGSQVVVEKASCDPLAVRLNH